MSESGESQTIRKGSFKGQMDLDTENKIAAILLKEAAELRRQAEQEGALVYPRRPNVRARPNSRFLTATVLGVQQANKAVEVNEMWRAWQKERDLDHRHNKWRSRGEGSNRGCNRDLSGNKSKRAYSNESGIDAACSANQRADEDCCSAQRGGLRDEEVDEFLRSRAKRGRGSIGSRMDEPGPYLPHLAGSEYVTLARSSDQDREQRRARVLGPEKSSSLNLYEASSEDEHHDRKKSKKWSSRSSSKHSKKHKSRDESRDKKKKRKY